MHNRHKLLTTALVGLLMLGLSTPVTAEITQQMDSADFTWQYEFGTDLPSVSDLDGNGVGDFNVNLNGGAIALADDVLTISCPAKGNVAYYYSGWGAGNKIWDVIDDLDLEHGVTVEMSVKVDAEAAEGYQGATALGVMPDGTNVDAKLYIGKTSQWWGEENYANFQQLGDGTHDNTSAFHAFRLALDPNTDTYSVWRDSELLGSGLGDTDSRGGLRRLVFGTFASSLSWGNADIDYVRFTSDAWAPVPEPSSLVLLLSILGLTAFHRRAR